MSFAQNLAAIELLDPQIPIFAAHVSRKLSTGSKHCIGFYAIVCVFVLVLDLQLAMSHQLATKLLCEVKFAAQVVDCCNSTSPAIGHQGVPLTQVEAAQIDQHFLATSRTSAECIRLMRQDPPKFVVPRAFFAQMRPTTKLDRVGVLRQH